MAKLLKYVVTKKDLNFKSLKKDVKAKLLNEYNLILRKPKGIYKKTEIVREKEVDENTKKEIEVIKKYEIDLYTSLYKYCKNTKRKDRQIIFHRVLLSDFSVKEYFMICYLLLLKEIDERDFNTIDFRPNRCKFENKKAKRNLEKSLADLKISMRNKIEKICKNEVTFFNMGMNHIFEIKWFNKAFNELAYIDGTRGFKKILTKYSEDDFQKFLLK